MKLNLPNLVPNWISNRVADPEGTAPKGLVFKIGVILLALMMASVIFLSEGESNGETANVEPDLPPPAGPKAAVKGEQDIQSATDRRSAEQARDQRRKREADQRARKFEQDFLREQAELEAEAVANREAIAQAQRDMTPEEELEQTLRLEKMQREDSSRRSPPVALSYRSQDEQASPVLVETSPPPTTAPAQQSSPDNTQPVEEPAATPAERALQESDIVAATQRPRSARGWERIDGGQWVEAVMVTQIRGDFPGPAIARVSTPFWSRDRQRILIPRGARFIGRVQTVQSVDQSRLSVTFDRLIFNNYNLRLPFAGLSQAGESGLQDQVKRHYLATFGAAGAVGVVSGLTLRNTQSMGFNVPAGQAARMEAGRSLGESASSIMSRYLNRMPTLIIRAGHRIRVYFVSDLLVPRRP